MTTKTRSGSLIATLLVIVVAGLAFWGWNQVNRFPFEDRDNEKVQVTISFEPKERKNPVTITVYLNGKSIAQDYVRRSPWSKSFSVAKGQWISVSADQKDSGKLTCAIQGLSRGGVDQDSRTVPGSVGCAYMW